MSLLSQKDKFSIPAGIHYLNNATFSPMSKRVEAVAHAAIEKMANPFTLKADDFFEEANVARQLFSRIINAGDPERIAIIPSSSYGLASVSANIHRSPLCVSGNKIVILEQEFPNDYYCFERIAQQHQLTIQTVAKPTTSSVGKDWNEAVLASIDTQTVLAVLPHVHWIYGIQFDLKAISQKCKETGTLLVIDATQSAGALPFDVQQIQVDAFIAGSYKSLLGPYQVGFAYYGPFFDEGIPIEESWMNRLESNQFHKLIEHQSQYRPKAQRYNVGEFSSFTNLPMAIEAMREILEWGPSNIQSYCQQLLRPYIKQFEALGLRLENEAYRANHLIGLGVPEGLSPIELQKILTKNKVFVAVRGDNIRVSLQIYNEPQDLDALIQTFYETR